MSEHWPPEWDDLDHADLDSADLDSADPGLLAEVTAALASLPLPALPDALEARISAAIAAEAATRAEPGGAGGESATARSLSSDSFFPAAADGRAATVPPASSRRPGRRRGSRRPATLPASGPAGSRPPGRGRRWLRPAPAIGSLAICLVIAGFGYLLAGRGTPSGATRSSAAAPAASAFHVASGSAKSASGSLPVEGQPGRAVPSPVLVVRETGTRYEPATLARQARAAVAAEKSVPSPGATVSAAASASAAGVSGSAGLNGLPASGALEGCVSHLTGSLTPSLVDRASYAGRPAYIIAGPRRVWVVGLGCTAAHPELITTVALAGLSGNLRALGSV